MTHIELENLASDYLEGVLGPARRAEVEAHLEGCASCRELVAGVRQAIEFCHSAEDLEPAPWLISKILLATVGERKPTLTERLAAWFRPATQPRFVYAVAMAVFSFSILANAAGINLRRLTVADLNPFTWAHRASVTGHRVYARAEKFYYDLRVVYEIESGFRRLRAEPQGEEPEAPKPEPPSGGSSDRLQLTDPELASVPNRITANPDREMIRAVSLVTTDGSAEMTRRSPSP